MLLYKNPSTHHTWNQIRRYLYEIFSRLSRFVYKKNYYVTVISHSSLVNQNMFGMIKKTFISYLRPLLKNGSVAFWLDSNITSKSTIPLFYSSKSETSIL